MTDLTLERRFPIAPEIVFDFVTREEHLSTWFGHPGWVLNDIKMGLLDVSCGFSQVVTA